MIDENSSLASIDLKYQDSLQQIPAFAPILFSDRAGWKNIYFIQFQSPPGETTGTHYPAQHIVSVCLNDHAAELELDGKWQSESYQCGDVLIFPANQPVPRVYCDTRVEYLCLCIEPTLFAEVALKSEGKSCIELASQMRACDPFIHQILLELRTELLLNELGSRFYAESMGLALAAHLVRRYSTQNLLLRHCSSGLPKHKLIKVINYIHDNLAHDLSLVELADIISTSTNYFVELFKASTGLSPHQYVTECRIERAKQLLANQELSIKDVMQRSGFRNQSHFTKTFRRYTNTTPKVYRNQI